MMGTRRRALAFDSLDAIGPEVDRLVAAAEAGRLQMVGSWSLAQIFWHLAAVARRVIDLPATTRHDPSLLVPDDARAQVFATGQIREGMPAPEAIQPPADLTDLRAEASRFHDALAYFRNHPTGPLAPHRFFGHLTRDEWEKLQCIHCAHHLSFAVPDDATEA
jgi:hypothetical protein